MRAGLSRAFALGLLGLAMSGSAFGKPPARPPAGAPAPQAPLEQFEPELRRLYAASDWIGLEALARQALTSLERASPESAHVASAATWLGRALNGQGRYAEAEPFFRRALAINAKTGGPDSIEAGASTANLADTLEQEGKYEEAEGLYGRVLAIDEKIVGADNLLLIERIDQISSVMEAKGRLHQAEALERRAVDIAEKHFGPNDTVVAARLDELASVLRAERSLAEAEQLDRRALAIEEKTGDEGGSTAAILQGLALTLEAEGRASEAEPLLKRSLAIDEAVDGTESASVSDGLRSLAIAQQALNQRADAVASTRRRLAIEEKIHGRDDPALVPVLKDLMTVLEDMGASTEAEVEALYRRGLAIEEANPEADIGAAVPETPTKGSENPFLEAATSPLGLLIMSGDHQALEAEALKEDAAVRAKADATPAELAGALWFRGDAYLLADKPEEAEVMFRAAWVIDENAPEPMPTALVMALAGHGEKATRLADAERLYRRATTIGSHAGGFTEFLAEHSWNAATDIMLREGRYHEAESFALNVFAIADRKYGRKGDNALITAAIMADAGGIFRHEGRFSKAEEMFRNAAEIEARTPDETASFALPKLGATLKDEGRLSEAEPILERALAQQPTKPAADEDAQARRDRVRGRLEILEDLAELKDLKGESDAAQVLFKQATGEAQASAVDEGPADDAYGQFLTRRGGYAEADRLFASANEAVRHAGPDDPVPDIATHWGELRLRQGRYSDAEKLFGQVLTADLKRLRPQHPDTAIAYRNLGYAQLHEGKFANAAANLRAGCSVMADTATAIQISLESKGSDEAKSTACMRDLARSLWGLARAGDKAGRLRDEAFVDAQRAVTSKAADALGDAAALAIAGKLGEGDKAAEYERSVRELDDLNHAYAAAVAKAKPEELEALAQSRDAGEARVARLEAELKVKASAYWDYRAPQPIGVEFLQATAGEDAKLLHSNEALVLWMVAPGADKGLVFAVSKAGFAWAEMGLTGDEIAADVAKLRREIDPGGYGARDIGDLSLAPPPEPFSLPTAQALDRALLGDPAIQAVVAGAGIDTLIVVPSGPLVSLPPSLLVSEAPMAGGPHWLGRDKALAVLPSVSSLRTLRQLLPGARKAPDLKLLAFADPDFRGTGEIPTDRKSGASPSSGPVPMARSLERDGRAGTDLGERLPPLYNTLEEGRNLAALLAPGDPKALLVGPDASKTNLLKRRDEGALARVAVLSFSTHGLLAGDFTGLTEPALALAHPPKTGADPSDDGLLKQSDVAALTLSADWVVLSACNTAAGDGKGAEGLSGLARGFFQAGASTLLVSHWRVDDAATEKLITETFELRAKGQGKAKALQAAMIEMMSDPARADPRFWAPFVIVGDPD